MGYSGEAIARKLKLTAGTVATLLNRARSKGYEVVIILSGDPLKLGLAEEDESAEEG